MARWMQQLDRVVYLSNQTDFSSLFDHWIAKKTSYRGRRVIPNGVDPTPHPCNSLAFREARRIPADAVVFLCVANYTKFKAQGYAAKAFRRAAIPHSVLVFIGSNYNLYSDLYQQEDALHQDAPNRILWLEKQSRENTLDAFASCDVFVLSSKYETQPICLLEAMREAKPWIARNAGCIPEMPGGICVTSIAEMSDHMQRLAACATTRRQLGTEGRRAVESSYNQSHSTQSHCQLISEVAADASPRG